MKKVLIKPILTEKTYDLAQNKNQYTFLVSKDSTKNQIEDMVKSKFEVEVTSVRIINQIGKKKRFGSSKRQGRRSDFKKAIVKLKDKQTIDLFEMK